MRALEFSSEASSRQIQNGTGVSAEISVGTQASPCTVKFVSPTGIPLPRA